MPLQSGDKMSKSVKKNKKKKNPANKGNTAAQKRKKTVKTALITAFVLLAATAAVVLIIIFSKNPNGDIINREWTSKKAVTASGDEAELADVYNVLYSQYSGTLTFQDDETFELWLTAGDPDDGTHKGQYKYENGVISAEFDSGETKDFTVNYSEDGSIDSIAVPYSNDNGSYTVYFY